MYCPKCGKQIPDESNFCMFCGGNLAELKSSMSIEVSPKIEVSAVAEGVPVPKWKPNPIKYCNMRSYGNLPLYKKFAEFNGKFFCPLCDNYDSVEEVKTLKYEEVQEKSYNVFKVRLFECLACNLKFLKLYDHKKYNIKVPKKNRSGALLPKV